VTRLSGGGTFVATHPENSAAPTSAEHNASILIVLSSFFYFADGYIMPYFPSVCKPCNSAGIPKPCRDEGTVETLQRLAACGNAMFADSGGAD
jgi:hypothetical protein